MCFREDHRMRLLAILDGRDGLVRLDLFPLDLGCTPDPLAPLLRLPPLLLISINLRFARLKRKRCSRGPLASQIASVFYFS